MSRFSDTPRALFASKTTFEALNVESGEESESEEQPSDIELLQDTRFVILVRVVTNYQDQCTICSSTQVSAKLSKSAIKKANRLARIERKQRLKRQSQPTEKESDTPEQATVPSEPQHAHFIEFDEIELSQPQLVEPRGILEAKPHDEVNGLLGEKVQPIESYMHLKADNHSAGVTPLSEPQLRNNTTPNVEMIPVSTNGSAAQDIHKDELLNAQVVEQAKKRQNVLTRTLWTFIMIAGFLGEPNCTNRWSCYMMVVISVYEPWTYLHDTSGHAVSNFGLSGSHCVILLENSSP